MKNEKMNYTSPNVDVKKIKLTDIMTDSTYVGEVFDGPNIGLGFDDMY